MTAFAAVTVRNTRYLPSNLLYRIIAAFFDTGLLQAYQSNTDVHVTMAAPAPLVVR